MRRQELIRRATLSVFAAILLVVPANFYGRSSPSADPKVEVNGFFSADKAQRGRTVQAAIVMDIPEGLHVNANKPLSKFAVPTTLKVETRGGIKIGPVSYPRAIVRRFSFSNDRLAVYEGKAVLRFNVNIPANQEVGLTELRARLRFQSCTDEVCFPPTTREITMPILIVGANESVKRINGHLFGGGRRR
ncbi:MAG TPA: protein-disulfide reductase DsbD domain-containing protein [Pyrinomonadaceae bacterium]|nr:protein-disulfide reductase DsbD domain-containing protein [Pyrinomonadaceae bacterium]